MSKLLKNITIRVLNNIFVERLPQRTRRIRLFAHPALERLEDRIVPTDFTWTGAGPKDNWGDARNWKDPGNTMKYPGQNGSTDDTATFDGTAKNNKATLDQKMYLVKLTLTGAGVTLDLQGYRLATRDLNMTQGTIVRGNLGISLSFGSNLSGTLRNVNLTVSALSDVRINNTLTLETSSLENLGVLVINQATILMRNSQIMNLSVDPLVAKMRFDGLCSLLGVDSRITNSNSLTVASPTSRVIVGVDYNNYDSTTQLRDNARMYLSSGMALNSHFVMDNATQLFFTNPTFSSQTEYWFGGNSKIIGTGIASGKVIFADQITIDSSLDVNDRINLYVLAGQVTFTMFSSLVIHGAMLWLGGSFKGSGPIMGPSGVVSLTDKAFCDIYAASTPLPFPLGAVFSTPPTLESAELRVGMTARVEQHENARL